MQFQKTIRITLTDLPSQEFLTGEQTITIFGAGQARLDLETLEAREVMSANPLAGISASLAGGVLHIEGGSGQDQIRIVEKLGQISVEDMATGQAIAIKSETASVMGVAVAGVHRVEVAPGEDADAIWVGDGSGFLTTPLQIISGEGNDRLYAAGTTTPAGLGDGVKQLLQFNGNTYTVDLNGEVSMNGSKLTFGGYALAGASLSVGDSGLAVTGLAKVPVFGMVQFTGVIDTKGDFALKTDVLESRELIGSLAKLDAPVITLTAEGAKLNAHAVIGTIGHAEVEGILTFDGNYKLTGKGTVELGPKKFEAIDFTLGSKDVEFTVPVESIGKVSFRGAYAPDGTWFIQGTYPQPVPVGNFTLENITVGIGNDRFSIGADVVPVPGIKGFVGVRFDGELYYDGRFTLTGKANVTVGPVALGDATVVISNDPATTKLKDRTVQMTIDGHAGIPYGPSVHLIGVVDGNGNYSLAGEDTFKIAGLELQKTRFTLNKADGFRYAGDWNYGIFTARLSGEITSGGKVTFEGDAATRKIGGLDLGTVHLKGEAEKGLFSFTSTTKTVSIGGFSVTDSTVTVTNRGTPGNAIVTTIQGAVNIPLGPKVTLTGTIDTNGNYDLGVVDTFKIAGLTLLETRFTLKSGQGFTFVGNLNLHVYNASVTGTIGTDGRVTFSGTDPSGSLAGFGLKDIKVTGDLNPRAAVYTVSFSATADLKVAELEIKGVAVGNPAGTWVNPSLTGRATAKGALGKLLNSEATFTVTTGGVTFTGTVKLPYDAGSYSVRGTVRTDGSFEIQGLSLPSALPGLDAIPGMADWAAQQVTALAQKADTILQGKLDALARQFSEGVAGVTKWKNDQITKVTKEFNEGVTKLWNWRNEQLASALKQANEGLANALKWKNNTIDQFERDLNTGLSDALKWKNNKIREFSGKANDAIDGLYTWANDGMNRAWGSMNDAINRINGSIQSWNNWYNGEYDRLRRWYDDAIGRLPGWARGLAKYVNPLVNSFNDAVNSAWNQTNQAIANLQASANSWRTWYNDQVNYFRSERDSSVRSWQTWYESKESWVLSEYRASVKSWKDWYQGKEKWALSEYNRSVKSWQDWYQSRESWVLSEYKSTLKKWQNWLRDQEEWALSENTRLMTSWQDWYSRAREAALKEVRNQLEPKFGASLEQQTEQKLEQLSTLRSLLDNASTTVRAQLQSHIERIADSLVDVILARASAQLKLKPLR